MSLLRKVSPWAALYALFLAARLLGLTLLPLFLDERIHLRWADSLAQGLRWKRAVLSGRGLTLALLAGVVPRADDLALAGRLLSVAAGAVTLLVCVRVAARLFGPRAGFLAGALYALCPFTVLYDRLVLADTFVAACGAGTLLKSIDLARQARWRDAVHLGLLLAAGIACKATGLLLLAVPVLAVLLLHPQPWRLAGKLAAALGLAFALVGYPLWLFFRGTGELAGAGPGEDYASEVAGNLAEAASWLWTYWTPPVIALAAGGLVLAVLRRSRVREAALLAALALGTPLAFAAAAHVWYPRYLLFATLPVLVLAASCADALLDAAWARATVVRVAAVAALLGALAPALRFDHALAADPVSAPWPAIDHFQYVSGWPSGYGSAEAAAFLAAEAARAPDGIEVLVLTPSATAGFLRAPFRRDGRIRTTLAVPEAPPPPPAGRPRFVLVTVAQGASLPPAWSAAARSVLMTHKPGGAVSDEVYSLN